MKFCKKILAYLIIFVIMILVFSLAMIVAYSLPNDKIQWHIKEERDYIVSQTYSSIIKGSTLDMFTDQLILNTAMNKGKSKEESIIVRAFENSRYSEPNGDQAVALQKTIDNAELYNNQEYARYWHGIQTIVRPLLLFFNYQEIRVLLMFLVFLLFALAIISIYKNFNTLYAIAFAFAITAVCFFIVPMAIQYVNVFAILFIGVILVNTLYRMKKQNLYGYLFFILGGLVVFFDLLTTPLLTLGIPLIFVMLLRNKEGVKFKNIFIEMIKLSVLWCIAYGSIFFTKWVIASLVMHQNIILNAFEQIVFRTSGNEACPATKLGAIKANFEHLYTNSLGFLFIIITIVWLITLVKYRKSFKEMKIVPILLLIALYPYIWYSVCAGHSTAHHFFTYRLQAITILSILCTMLETIDTNKLKLRRKN